jgi:hypothetical protein
MRSDTAQRLSASPSDPAAVQHPNETDPIFEVVGVPAAEILRRCREIRGGGRLHVRLRSAGSAAESWRLLDFADISDKDFVFEAHRVLLGRTPSSSERERRLRELRNGSSRMQILVRLGLSPEGRSAERRRVHGLGLRVLGLTARVIESAQANPALARTVRSGERAVRAALEKRATEAREPHREPRR